MAEGTIDALHGMLPPMPPKKVEPPRASLEDVFLHLTGRALRD